jgi:alpha-amylase
MRSICLCFQVHQPVRLKKFRFFEIGNSDYYYDDFNNEMIIRRVAENCYLPSNKIILDLINKYQGRFRVSFSISGTAIDQFKIYAPEVIESFRELAATGCVEFLAETYSHSLAVMKNKDNFKKQADRICKYRINLFGRDWGNSCRYGLQSHFG